MVSSALIHVEVVYAPAPRTVKCVELTLPAGSSVELAVQKSGLLDGLSVEMVRTLDVGVWGRKAATHYVLRDKDRVELYRPLAVDPKVARRERFIKQGAKSAGLFSKRRAGAKSGY